MMLEDPDPIGDHQGVPPFRLLVQDRDLLIRALDETVSEKGTTFICFCSKVLNDDNNVSHHLVHGNQKLDDTFRARSLLCWMSCRIVWFDYCKIFDMDCDVN